jgi:hypothetical protein
MQKILIALPPDPLSKLGIIKDRDIFVWRGGG